MVNKLCTAEEAVTLIKDGDAIVITAFIRSMLPEELVNALQTRWLETNMPRDLTLINGAALSDFGNGKLCGFNNLAYEGLIKRTVSGFYGNGDLLKKLIYQNKVESYNFPLGVITHMLREFARGKDGEYSKIGLKTYVDPRFGGARMNSISKESYVQLVELGGEEYLYYTCPKPNVAFIRGTTADEFGNVTFEDEAILSIARVAAMSVYQNHGTVICQVKNFVQGGSLNAQVVHIPGVFVDKVVVCTEPEKHHRQTSGIFVDPVFSGRYRRSRLTAEVLPLDERKIIGRRAAMELMPEAVINIGIGMPETVSSVAAEEGIADKLILTVETGGIGGIPAGGGNFGACANNWAMVDEDIQFDLYDGGGLDICFLGGAEISPKGDVNVSKFNGVMMGCGGFINISQPTRNIVFCSTFTAGGLEVAVNDGTLKIVNEGHIVKFKNMIEQVTFSGEYAAETNQNVLFITERAVFKLTAEGLVLTEIAPGVDLNKDVLSNMEFAPIISQNLKLMDSRIFRPELMGIKDIIVNKAGKFGIRF